MESCYREQPRATHYRICIITTPPAVLSPVHQRVNRIERQLDQSVAISDVCLDSLRKQFGMLFPVDVQPPFVAGELHLRQ